MSEVITRTITKRKICNREGAFTCEGGYWVIVSLKLWLTINKIIQKKIWKFHKRKIYQIGTCTKRQSLLKAIALCLKITSFGTQIYKIIYGKDKEKKEKDLLKLANTLN